MARIRTIKPDFFKDEKIADLAFEQRLLFQGLWLLADREGRFEDRPRYIKIEIFPYDDVDIDTGLHGLAQAGLILRYDGPENKKYIQIVNFLKHQRPNHREPPSTIPAPVSTGMLMHAQEEGKGKGKGKEEEGERITLEEADKKSPPSKKTHPRLEVFAEEYKTTTGRDYVIGDYREEAGAASRTITKIPDETLYRQAARAYLGCTDKRIVEAGYPFLWFIRELNRWVSQALPGGKIPANMRGLHEYVQGKKEAGLL